MKTLILYTSKTGATEQYAKWLHQDCSESTLVKFNAHKITILDNFERIIFLLPTYGGKIAKKEFIEENWEILKTKNVFLIVVGMIPQNSPWSKKSFESLDEKVRNGLKGYMKLPGIPPKGSKKNMGFLKKFMMRIFLKTDPDTIIMQKEVKKEDLFPVTQMIKSCN